MNNHAFLVFIVVMVLFLTIIICYYSSCERFSATTGVSYADGCAKLPVPQNIMSSSKSPPFYDLGAIRPALCSYRNYTFPPPLGYTPIEEPPSQYDIYQYWFKDAVLSHPQTAYLV